MIIIPFITRSPLKLFYYFTLPASLNMNCYRVLHLCPCINLSSEKMNAITLGKKKNTPFSDQVNTTTRQISTKWHNCRMIDIWDEDTDKTVHIEKK